MGHRESSEQEWLTRKSRVDTKLQKIGWKVATFNSALNVSDLTHHAVAEYPTESGPVDYALFVEGKLLGVVEAKRVRVGPQNVLEQAKRYSKTARGGEGNWGGHKVPFLYSTNGQVTWFLDAREDKLRSRELKSFHSPKALKEFFSRNLRESHRWLESHPINIAGLRPYQLEAVTAVERALCDDKRAMLIAMATGTGKTFTTVAMLHRLLKSNSAKRVLFLVDRKALAVQAAKTFSSFSTPSGNKFDQEYEVYTQKFKAEELRDDEYKSKELFNPKVLPNDYLTDPDEKHTFVYISTVQRMAINLYGREGVFGPNDEGECEEAAEVLNIPIHAFDLIVVDECHRGYTARAFSIWRQTIEYFDAIKVGLTATPAPHTLALFTEVVFRYGVDRAIQEGYLVDWEAVTINSDVRLNGLFLQEGEQVTKVNPYTGEKLYDELEDEREFLTDEIEKKITAPDSNRKIIAEFAKYARIHEEKYGRFPKTLIFAVNDLQHTSHCDQIVDLCRKEFDRGDDFVQKITGNPNVDRPLQKIRQLRNRPNPKIAVTVDMLTTGVDIPALECLVFMRPVKSRILWEQMLGRGTRTCDDINKTHFTVFDCFDGTLIRYFRDVSDFEFTPATSPSVPIAKIIENIWKNEDRDHNVKVLVKRLRRIEKDMSGEAVDKFAAYIERGDIRKYADNLTENVQNNFKPTLDLLRNKDFQELLNDYPRANRTFLVAEEAKDHVSSEARYKLGGSPLSPNNYIEAFVDFVQTNADECESLRILLGNPSHWNSSALASLRDKLLMGGFKEGDLEGAFAQAHNVTTEIISMAKHALSDNNRLYRPEDRVQVAMENFNSAHRFNDEESEWLKLIEAHLIQNLSIEIEDFNLFPIFERKGGLRKAKETFELPIDQLVRGLNEAVAAA